MNTIMHAVDWLYHLNDAQRTLVLVAFIASVGAGAWIAQRFLECFFAREVGENDEYEAYVARQKELEKKYEEQYGKIRDL